MKKTLLILFASANLFAQQGWFQQVSGTNMNLNSVYFINTDTGFVAVNNGLILKTTNGGTNWILINTGTNLNLYQILFVNSSTGFAGTDTNTIRTTNSGVTWNISIVGGGRSISFINQTIGYALRGWQTLMKSTNSGINWVQAGIIPSMYGVDRILFRNENTGYACNKWYYNNPPAPYYLSSIDKTTNSGINWAVHYSSGMSAGAYISDIFFLNDLFGAAVHTIINLQARYYFSKSTNAGENWNQVELTEQKYSVRFTDSNNGWTCGMNGGILYSSNGGNNWSTQVSNVSTRLNSVFMVNQNTGWIVGNSGVILKTTNGGVLAVTPVSNYVPKEFSLFQNYPNPFNPTTKIKFAVPLDSRIRGNDNVVLKVYDALGREVQTLVNEGLQPGTYEVDFDGTNYPSGVYYYTLNSNSFTETKRMVLIK